MLELLLAPQNQPFTVAITLMVLIALLEGVGTLLGAGIFSFLDALIPDIDGDLNVGAVEASGADSLGDINAPEAGSAGALSRFLGWLRIGKVPVLMLLIIFLTAFGISGYMIQGLAAGTAGVFLPSWLAAGLACLASFPVVRTGALALEKLLPRMESSAVSPESFIGRMATITIGTATSDMAAEARLMDQHGQAHYIHVKPEAGHAELSPGVPLLVVRQEDGVFIAIENNDQLMVD